jgi:glycosyltransferase involved in cell wall biosynthesis
VTFIAQKEFVDRLLLDGLRQVHWLPLAFAPELHPLQEEERCYDVAYVGSNSAIVHPERHAMLAAIRSEFPKVFMGLGSPKDMGRIYSQAKLVFNKSVNNDVNMRYFEAMGAGAVLLTDLTRNNGVDELFNVGEHYLQYDDEKILLDLIRSLLENAERCRRIGDAARIHILEKHTYLHRAEQLLGIVRKSSKLSAPRPEDFFSAFLALNLLDAALDSAGRGLAQTSGGMYSKVVGGGAGMLLSGIGKVLGIIELVRSAFRRS